MVGLMDRVIKHYSSLMVIETLGQYLTEARREKIDTILDRRLNSIHIAIESPADPHNALATVRTAEAFGIFNVHIVDSEYNGGNRASSGANRWVNIERHGSLETLPEIPFMGAALRQSGCLYDLPIDQPFCILFGNEHRGLSDKAIDACAHTFTIPMYGMVESFNLSVSVALALQHLTRKRREFLGKKGDLIETDLLKERAKCYIRTLRLDKSKMLLEHHLG